MKKKKLFFVRDILREYIFYIFVLYFETIKLRKSKKAAIRMAIINY